MKKLRVGRPNLYFSVEIDARPHNTSFEQLGLPFIIVRFQALVCYGGRFVNDGVSARDKRIRCPKLASECVLDNLRTVIAWAQDNHDNVILINRYRSWDAHVRRCLPVSLWLLVLRIVCGGL